MMEDVDEYIDNSDGSAEKLLASSEQTERTDLVNSDDDVDVDDDDDDNIDDDDDIAKLMGFIDNTSDDEHSEKAHKHSKRPLMRTSEADISSAISSKSLKIESIPEYLNITPCDIPSKPLSAAVLKRQRKMEKIYSKTNSQTSKMVCGVLCMFVILGIGGALLFFAVTLGMRDLYIIGGIFAGGGVLFTLSFIILRCIEFKETGYSDYSSLYKSAV